MKINWTGLLQYYTVSGNMLHACLLLLPALKKFKSYYPVKTLKICRPSWVIGMYHPHNIQKLVTNLFWYLPIKHNQRIKQKQKDYLHGTIKNGMFQASIFSFKILQPISKNGINVHIFVHVSWASASLTFTIIWPITIYGNIHNDVTKKLVKRLIWNIKMWIYWHKNLIFHLKR